MDSTREMISSRAALAAVPSVVAGGIWVVTSGCKKQASVRARNTAQDSSTSRKELKVGLAKVWTGAWVST